MKIPIFISFFVILLALSCDKDDNVVPGDKCLDGQGAIVSETRVLPDFHSVNNTIYADILLTQGPQEDIIIEAQQNILDELNTEVVNEELRLTFDRCVDIQNAVKVHMIIPEIKSLKLGGVGNITSQNEFDLADLKLTLAGVGNFDLQGTATTLDVTLAGVGTVKAFQLDVDVCDIDIAGIGDAEVFVNDELDVKIAGTGTVYYKGNPAITSSISGTGQIVNAN